MVDAPEKIWAASVTENYGEWQTTTDGLPRPTEYTRSDLVAELAAENERLKQAIADANADRDRWYESSFRANSRTEALSRQLAEREAHRLKVCEENGRIVRTFIEKDRQLAEARAELARLVDRCEELAGAKDDGATYVLAHLAELLKLERWSIHDGSETWEGDVSSSLYHILVDAGVIDDETGELAARAALSGGSGDGGWKSMESAPKDGTRILLGNCYSDGEWWPQVGYVMPEAVYRLNGERFPKAGEVGSPTHWMPRPLPAGTE